MPIDPRAISKWRRANNAYQHYLQYMAEKPDRLALTFTDLLYVKNFKGGNSVIEEPTATAGTKLAHYEQAIRSFNAVPGAQLTLAQLDDGQYELAREKMVAFAGLPIKLEAKIKGFSVSFASALLHFYYPNLVPILDRRALNGSLISGLSINGQGQVTNLLDLYPALIDYFRGRLREDPLLTLRALDRQLFEVKLRAPPPHRKRGAD